MRFKSSESGGILGILAGVLLVVVGIVLMIVIGGLHFARNVRVEHEGEGRDKLVKIETPAGSVRVRNIEGLDAKHMGVPVYPGATLKDDDSHAVTIEFDSGDEHKDLTTVAAVYKTDDSVDSVRRFYRKELPHWIITKKGFEYSEGGYKRFIVIHREHGETTIALASLGEPAAN